MKLYKELEMPFFPPRINVRQIIFIIIIVGDKVYKTNQRRRKEKETNK